MPAKSFDTQFSSGALAALRKSREARQVHGSRKQPQDSSISYHVNSSNININRSQDFGTANRSNSPTESADIEDTAKIVNNMNRGSTGKRNKTTKVETAIKVANGPQQKFELQEEEMYEINSSLTIPWKIYNDSGLDNRIAKQDLFVEMCFFARLGFLQPPCCLRCAHRDSSAASNTSESTSTNDSVKESCTRQVVWRKNATLLLHPNKLDGNLFLLSCRAAKRLLRGETVVSSYSNKENLSVKYEVKWDSLGKCLVMDEMTMSG